VWVDQKEQQLAEKTDGCHLGSSLSQPDFQQQTTILHDVIEARGHIRFCRVYPKFHCELSPIEMFWNRQKAFVRRNYGYNIKSLRWTAVRLGLEAVHVC
jgi:hypothetical protein